MGKGNSEGWFQPKLNGFAAGGAAVSANISAGDWRSAFATAYGCVRFPCIEIDGAVLNRDNEDVEASTLTF